VYTLRQRLSVRSGGEKILLVRSTVLPASPAVVSAFSTPPNSLSGVYARGSKFLMMVGTSEMVQLDLLQFQLHMSQVCRHPYFGGNRWRKVAIATH
jgi:hypothetical protein